MTIEEEIQRLTNQYLADMAEFTDAVQVVATWEEDGQSNFAFAGRGNYFARYGMVQEFIERCQNNTANEAYMGGDDEPV